MNSSIDSKIKQKEAELVKLKNKVNSQKSDEPIQVVSEDSEHNADEQDVQEVQEKSKVDEFVEALRSAAGKRLLVCIKGYPDPDNIATSLALSYLARQFDIDSTIVHFEQISHHENRALVKKLDLDIEEYSEQFDYTSFDYYAINDSQSPELPIKLPETCKLLIFVDHHKRLGTIKGEFVDIRDTTIQISRNRLKIRTNT